MSSQRYFMQPIQQFNGTGPPSLQTSSGGAPATTDNASQLDIVNPQSGPPVPIARDGTSESLVDQVLTPYPGVMPPFG